MTAASAATFQSESVGPGSGSGSSHRAWPGPDLGVVRPYEGPGYREDLNM